MIQEQLLLTDLCARLPYGVKISTHDGNQTMVGIICTNGGGKVYTSNMLYNISQVKPYLRPMSSMTEEEEETYHNLCYEEESGTFEFGKWVGKIYYHDTKDSIDYLNSIHIDYRGLIENGLALEAPNEIYEK